MFLMSLDICLLSLSLSLASVFLNETRRLIALSRGWYGLIEIVWYAVGAFEILLADFDEGLGFFFLLERIGEIISGLISPIDGFSHLGV